MFDCLLCLIPISHKVDLVKDYQPFTGISAACGTTALQQTWNLGLVLSCQMSYMLLW